MVALWPVEHASHAGFEVELFEPVFELFEVPCSKWNTGPGFESRVKRASQFKKSQTAVPTTERKFTLSVVCLIPTRRPSIGLVPETGMFL